MNYSKQFRVKPGSEVDLGKVDAAAYFRFI